MGVALAILFCQIAAQAQTGSISGTVVDSQGAVVPGASVAIKGQNGSTFTATTNNDGFFIVPGVLAGTPTYTVTVSAKNFKTSVVENVKVDVATPASVSVTLTAGQVSEIVVVTSGAEVLQTETATVGTTIAGRQILETPIQSRDALDLVTLLPGTATLGVVRTSTINGLPKSALTIQIDGVDVQDSYLKSSDGFFTFIRPRIDAIDEVTVSTAVPGAESSGDGAVGIRFQTRRGTDDYHGSAFWQHRDEGLNATNFQNNYQKLAKTKLRLNQFGGSYGGPIPFFNFGDSGGPLWDNGKGKRFFFVNYERFHLNENSPVRTRQVLTSEGQNGIFRYRGTIPGTGIPAAVPGLSCAAVSGVANTMECTRDLFALGGAAGLTNTIDPTVQNMLNLIRSATTTTGTFDPLGTGGLWFRQPYNFANPGNQRRAFLAVRIDANIGKNHSIEGIFNNQPFRSTADFLNTVDPNFPGFANAGTQQSDRRSLSVGFRSSFGTNVVNQFRYSQLAGWLGGATRFDLVGGSEWFDQMKGFSLGFGAGLTGPTIRNAFSSRVSPTQDFTDNVTWVKGNHTFTFGGQLKKIETISDDTGLFKPTVTLSVATGDPLIAAMPLSAFPGATEADRTNAQQLFATLTGRISAFGANAVLSADGKYVLNGPRHFEIQENTNGLFAQDTWRIRPNLSINYGIRWQPQLGAKMNSTNYTLLSDPKMLWDTTGPQPPFTPTVQGTQPVPTVRLNAPGERAFDNDYNNFAPSVGVVWSPNSAPGFLGKVFGNNGTSVFRGGWSRSFIREGTLIVETSVGRNPGGGNLTAGRSTGAGTLSVGTLFRTAGNPNLTPISFSEAPVFPRTVTASDNQYGFEPGFHSGYVDSYSFGYQRQIGKDTVVEARYVGNRGKEMASIYNLNEINAIENGFGSEYRLAQQNLQLNIAAGRGNTFGYSPLWTGTSPLPILVSYLVPHGATPGPAGNPDPNVAATYSNANFSSSTYFNFLSVANPSVQGLANALQTLAANRTNGTANGRPTNFIHNCPTTVGFCFQFDNSEKSWYDAAVIEVRRRLSSGFRFQASYTWSKAFTNAFASANTSFFGLGAGDQGNAANNSLRDRSIDKSPAQVDLRHAFKFDATWDLPFGTGRQFLSSSNGVVNAIVGGWSIVPTVRWQSGSPVLLENVQLVGMTVKELQKKIGVYYNTTVTGTGSPIVANVTWLPADIIDNTIRAFTTTATTATGYGAGQAPTGKFIAPAGYGNCQYRSVSELCGFRKLVLYGPSFFKIDAAIQKKFNIGEKRDIQFRATIFDVLNHTNWRLGGWTGNVNNISTFTGQFGQMLGGWAYQDPSGSNDPGGRLLDLMVRINF